VAAALLALVGGLSGKISAIWLLTGIAGALSAMIASFWFSKPTGLSIFFGAHLALFLAGVLKTGALDPLPATWFAFSWIGACHFTRTHAAFSESGAHRRPPLSTMLKNVAVLAALVFALYIPWSLLVSMKAPAAGVQAPAGPILSPGSGAAGVDMERVIKLLTMTAVLLLALLVCLMIYLKKSRKEKSLLRVRDAGSRIDIETAEGGRPPDPERYRDTGLSGKIIEEYARLLTLWKKTGYSREPSETPLEFARRVGGLFPQLSTPFQTVTAIYHQARYGGDSPAPADYDRFAGHLHEIQRLPPFR